MTTVLRLEGIVTSTRWAWATRGSSTKRHKHTFYPTSTGGPPKDIDQILIDQRSHSCLEDVKAMPGVIISTSETFVAGSLIGHRAVVAQLRCRLQAREANVPQAP